MNHRVHSSSLGVAGFAAVVALWPAMPADAAPGKAPIVMVPHRAVYDMTLGEARSGASVSDVEGRMVFEITGSACEGYTQNMRFVTKMASSDGEPSITDLRSTTYENGTATQFRFTGTQLRDEKPTDGATGDATRSTTSAPLTVELTQPEKKTLKLGPNVYLPVQHSIALVEAGRAGQSRFKADLYDGSEQGEKLYETSSTIGKEVPAGGNKKLPVVKNAERLDGLSAWPVTISYYEKGAAGQDAAPAYELGFLFYENGVSRNLLIDYGDFSIKGDLKEITFLEPTADSAKCGAAK